MNTGSFYAIEGRVRMKMVVAYVGTNYCGWQIQARPEGDLPTIQGFLVEAVSKIAGMRVYVHGAGRTDSGVHAQAQVAHMDIPQKTLTIDWQLALNNMLPSDIRIVSVEPMTVPFHAQLSAVKKVYCYRLWLNRRYTPPWLYPFVWACGELDIDVMDKAATYLQGEHDFSSLRNVGTELATSVRTVHNIWRTPAELKGACLGDIEVQWFFEANGFLKQMVRNIMGLLVAVGRHQLQPEKIFEILEAKNRKHCGVTAPARGLTMLEVNYK